MGWRLGAAKTALGAGADVNGFADEPYAPIVAALIPDYLDMVIFSLEHD